MSFNYNGLPLALAATILMNDMSLRLPPALAGLLREVIATRRPDLIQLVDASIVLSDEDRAALREALADELMESGLREDSEPNTRGHQIEDLIDKLGRL